MSTNVGNLNATLSLSEFEFINGLKQSETASKDFAETVEVSAKRANAAMSSDSGRKFATDWGQKDRTLTEGQQKAEADHLRWMLLSKKEQHAFQKMADLEHISSLLKAKAISEAEAVALTKRAGSLGGAGGGMGSIGGKLAGMTQQAGYAIQDFHSQFATRGIGPAIGAVSNNVAMLGAAFGPVPAAITAVAAALGGILLPKILESTGWFGKSKEALAEYRKEIDTFYDGFRKQGAEKASFIERDPKELDKELQKKRDLYRTNHEEILALNKTQAMQEAAGEGELAMETYKKALERSKENEKISAEGKALAAARPEVEAAQAERDRKKADAEREKEYLKSLTEGNEALVKLKQEGLEKYGTENEKLASKQAREMDELKSKTKDLSGYQQDESRAALLAQQATETQKLKVSEEQAKLNEMGAAAKGSAGVSRGSAEGVNAINRAVTGTLSEQDIAKKSLKTQEESLKRLQEIARQKSNVIMVQLSS